MGTVTRRSRPPERTANEMVPAHVRQALIGRTPVLDAFTVAMTTGGAAGVVVAGQFGEGWPFPVVFPVCKSCRAC